MRSCPDTDIDPHLFTFFILSIDPLHYKQVTRKCFPRYSLISSHAGLQQKSAEIAFFYQGCKQKFITNK